MKDILLERNKLMKNSIKMRSMKFDPELNDKQIAEITKQQNKIYKKWYFYDKFIKAREEVKSEDKFNDVGKEK